MSQVPVKENLALIAIVNGATTTSHIRSVLKQPNIQCAQSVVKQLERKGLIRRIGSTTHVDHTEIGEFGPIRSNSIMYVATERGCDLVELKVRNA